MEHPHVTPEELVEELTIVGAIKIHRNPVTLAHAKPSHLYFNIGDRVISAPKAKDVVVRALAQTWRENSLDAKRLVGVPEGANLITSSLGDRLGIGQLRVRELRLPHGQQSSIEGIFSRGMKVSVVEDVISTGNSTISRVIDPLKEARLNPVSVIGLIDRQAGGIRNLLDIPGIKAVYTFTNITEIIRIMLSQDYLISDEIKILESELTAIKSSN